MQPFAVAYLLQKPVAEQHELINMHELLQEGAPSLTDILDLKAASKISMVPTKESQMMWTLWAFGVVLAITIGTTSQLYHMYKKEAIDSYESIQPKLETLAKTCTWELVYAEVLRWLQLCFQEYWMDTKVLSGLVEPPNFKLLFTSIWNKQWLHPASYLQGGELLVHPKQMGAILGAAAGPLRVPWKGRELKRTQRQNMHTQPVNHQRRVYW
jgi:hypothetical protein